MENRRDKQNQGGKGGARPYRGGQQGQGGVPNPDDVDDDSSAGSFRGSDQGTPVDETDEGPQEVVVGQNQNNDPKKRPSETK
jgi:hypothetical protein